MDKTKKDWIFISVVSLVLFSASLLFRFLAPEEYVSKFVVFIVPFLFGMTVLTRIIHQNLEKKDNASQKLFHVVTSVFKMFIYLIMLIIMGVIGIDNIASFYISFLVFYLIFMYIDVRHQMKYLSK